jgi:hypothetical protein
MNWPILHALPGSLPFLSDATALARFAVRTGPKRQSCCINPSGGAMRQVFGVLDILPADGHIKVGKFIPNFGTKPDDHTACIRSIPGFSNASVIRPELTAAEVGVSPGHFTVAGGSYNATDGYAGSGGTCISVGGKRLHEGE